MEAYGQDGGGKERWGKEQVPLVRDRTLVVGIPAVCSSTHLPATTTLPEATHAMAAEKSLAKASLIFLAASLVVLSLLAASLVVLSLRCGGDAKMNK